MYNQCHSLAKRQVSTALKVLFSKNSQNEMLLSCESMDPYLNLSDILMQDHANLCIDQVLAYGLLRRTLLSSDIFPSACFHTRLSFALGLQLTCVSSRRYCPLLIPCSSERTHLWSGWMDVGYYCDRLDHILGRIVGGLWNFGTEESLSVKSSVSYFVRALKTRMLRAVQRRKPGS